MLFILGAALSLATAAMAQDCDMLSGGPSMEARSAAANWLKENYIKGEVCPEGCGLLDCAGPYCVVCEDVYMAILKSADNSADYCLTEEEFDDALDSMGEGTSRCIVFVESDYLSVGMGWADEFDGAGEEPCPNVC